VNARTQALTELGDHSMQVARAIVGAWGQVKGQLGDPVALDKFALQLLTVSQALGQLSERTQQLAEVILDGEED